MIYVENRIISQVFCFAFPFATCIRTEMYNHPLTLPPPPPPCSPETVSCSGGCRSVSTFPSNDYYRHVHKLKSTTATSFTTIRYDRPFIMTTATHSDCGTMQHTHTHFLSSTLDIRFLLQFFGTCFSFSLECIAK